ncbi:hypothetical protein [Clostridium ljungdahlii]|uniref:hypothetical protein n=1 Tax=Clostridium ljungdahlii TaxID=1538 RepID=UPI0038696B12
MKSKLRAEIEVRDNYRIPAWENVGQPNWLVEDLNNMNIEIPFTDQTDLIPFKIKSTLGHITVEGEVFLGEIKHSDEDLQSYRYEKDIAGQKKQILLQEFEVRINDLFLALQISQPARIDFLKIMLFLDDIESKPLYYEKLLSPSLAYISLDYGNFNRDIIDMIDFFKVWKWLLEQNDFWNEVPESTIGIFLNYFRYFHYDSSPLSLMWIAMALESILVSNDRFSQSQIKGKLKLLLKECYDESKINKFVDGFYQLRSKIAHGKQKLFRPTLIHDALDSVEKLDKLFGKMVSLATLL